MANMYAIPALTTWNSTPGGWSDTSGGTSNGLVPDSSTHVLFDANSGAARTIAMATDAAYCLSFGTIGAVNAITLTGTLHAYGNVNLTGLASVDQVTFAASGSINQAACVLDTLSATSPAVLTAPITISPRWISVGDGATFTASDNVTAEGIVAYGAATINFGAGTWLFYGNSTAFTIASTCTVNASTSTIRLTGTSVTFAGGGKTYNNFWWDALNTCTITGANTFNDVKIAGSSTNLVFPSSATTTLATLTADGTPYLTMSINSSSPGTPATIAKSGGGTLMVYNCQITDITASPGSTFYATRSVDGGGNTNWTFVVIYSGFFFHM